MLNIKGVSFFYSRNNILLENLSLDIKNHGILGIYGPSGSGKTTLIKLIGGIIKPNLGEIFFQNKNIFKYSFNDLSKYRNHKVGFAFQNFNLLDDFSVWENINLPFTISSFKIKQSSDWINHLIVFLGIKDILKNKVKNISGGEKERVSIIKSMIHQPPILILDEPGSYLNDKLKYKVYDLIKDYSKSHTCIITSHDISMKEYLGLNFLFKNQEIDIYSNN